MSRRPARRALARLAVALVAVPWAAAGARSEVAVLDPPNAVFLSGTAPRDTVRILAGVSGPPLAEVGFARLRRTWGLHLPSGAGRVRGLPSFYQLSASCPACNGIASCEHRLDTGALDRLLAPHGIGLGPAHLDRVAEIDGVSGLQAGREAVLAELWRAGRAAGVYRVRENAIRLNSQSIYYHLVELPATAPEGAYRVTTVFFAADRVVGTAGDEFVLRRRGPGAWLARSAEEDRVRYGTAAVVLALLAGLGVSRFANGAPTPPPSP